MAHSIDQCVDLAVTQRLRLFRAFELGCKREIAVAHTEAFHDNFHRGACILVITDCHAAPIALQSWKIVILPLIGA
jgi:hypothetical protein